MNDKLSSDWEPDSEGWSIETNYDSSIITEQKHEPRLSSAERRGQLQYLLNRFGDFMVAKSWMLPDGNIQFTKHHSVMDLCSSENKMRLLDDMNHRTIFQSEIVLDIDNEPSIEKMNTICDKLDQLDVKYKAYFSGSKGYHIHIIIPEILNLNNIAAEKIREFWIKQFDCDVHKKSTKTMIALENVPHWKTGKTKTLLRESKKYGY